MRGLAPKKRLFGSVRHREDFFLSLSEILVYNTDLRLLLGRLSRFFGQFFATKQAIFAVRFNDEFRLFGTKGHTYPPKADLQIIASRVCRHQDYNKVLLVKDLEDTLVQKSMSMHEIELVLPLAFQAEYVGCLLLGPATRGRYTSRDLRLIEAASGGLAMALKSASAVEEIRQLNDTLQQRVDEAVKELKASNQQLQRLDKAKDEFISMASHQLRTPLTSIKGYLDMVLQGDLGPINTTQKAVLTEAFFSSERMVRLISDFLNVSRLQTGKFLIDRQPTDIAQLVREDVALLRSSARHKRVAIKTSIARGVPLLSVDGDKISQVVLNLIDNAVHYSYPDTTVSVSLNHTDDAVEFRVKDTGIGIPAEEQQGLFGKFFRASNARKKRPDGTGIGLFLARKIIKSHGGEVFFESAENRGSTFGFRLPVPKSKKA